MNHARQATRFVANQERAQWHDRALWFVRQKRDRIVNTIPEWERLRELASQIKSYTVTNLADLLEQFADRASERGVQVHWAVDAKQHNQIVLNILQQNNARRVIKSKSMLTEECHLNPYLEQNGISVVDSDLGERIVQLRRESPSHIVLPAIHIRKQEVGDLFHEHLGTEAGADDPDYLTGAARVHLRQEFLKADAGITGVNFAIAQTGGFVVCTNEGNADLGVSLPKIHIACMGLEKLLPCAEHLGVFLRLLARSATGQPITTYSSHFHGPQPGGQLHIVIVDNGRSQILASETFRRSLNCIRCGACMNTCPVYRRSGGHSYGTTVPGPIGSILAPARNAEKYNSLPYACTLCGSCTDVCPVKIDLHHQLLHWRSEIVKLKLLPWFDRFKMKWAAWIMSRPGRYRWFGRMGRRLLRYSPRFLVYNRFNKWGLQRELPEPPKKSFGELYQLRNQRQENGDE